MNFLFLLGAGRSGSTLLYKLLSLHPKVGYVSNYNNSFPAWIPSGYLNRSVANRLALKRRAWFEKSGNAHGFNRRLLDRIIPCPVEGERIYSRAGIPLFNFDISEGEIDQATNKFYASMLGLAEQQSAHIMLSKRVANNRRIPWLTRAFPKARYIHLIRDGRDVAYSFSKISWWNESAEVWWSGRSMGEMVDEGWDSLSITARTWVEAVREVDEKLSVMPSGLVMNVRYEELISQPESTLGKIFEFLGVDFGEKYLDQLSALQLRYTHSKWRDAWTKDEVETVLDQQHDLLKKLSYL